MPRACPVVSYGHSYYQEYRNRSEATGSFRGDSRFLLAGP